MSWQLLHVGCAAVLGALFLFATACGPSPSTPTSASTPAASKPVAQPNVTPASVEAVSQGQALLAQKGCGGCHTIPGVAGATGTIGPSLAGVASRTRIAGGALPNNGPEDLKRWILDPPAQKPGTQMPKLGLWDEEASRIVAYLETLT